MEKIELWQHENQLAMHGWDFSHLKGRWDNQALPWNYRQLVQAHMQDAQMWLDVDTGGGELMDSFHHPADNTVVTEGWAPNLTLLQQKYANSDVRVIADPNEDLAQVPNDQFELITNSHGALAVQATVEKLRSNGLFITQQVGGTNNFALSRFLNTNYVPAFPDNTLLSVSARLQAAEMVILYQDAAYSRMRFFDVGAIVYYATVIPWEFPEFSVDKCLSQLQALDALIKTTGAISCFEDRFMIVARKP